MNDVQRCIMCEWNTIDIDKQRQAIRALTTEVEAQKNEINLLLRVAGMAEITR